MKVKTYGVRGSLPISRDDARKYGGNTTCVRVISDRIPAGHALVIDAGTGLPECSKDLLLNEKAMNIALLMTHYHHDHTQGLLMAMHTFHPDARYRIWGPKEHSAGPAEIFGQIMRPPHFPVPFEKVRDRFAFKAMDPIGTHVLVVHPEAGFHLLQLARYRSLCTAGKQLPLGHYRFSAAECLVIHMWKTGHPEYTVSYRVEERTTGKVFVFLTDHENTEGMPGDLRNHVTGADLLIQDSQYAESAYRQRFTGFGHGTPEYCALVAGEAGVKNLGLTHHDPNASDTEVELRLSEARRRAKELGKLNPDKIFACACYQEITL